MAGAMPALGYSGATDPGRYFVPKNSSTPRAAALVLSPRSAKLVSGGSARSALTARPETVANCLNFRHSEENIMIILFYTK